MASCAICEKAIETRPANAFFPFCGARCRQVDLGRWLNEDYRIASKPDEDEDENGSPEDA
jgi:uncharacterized protein